MKPACLLALVCLTAGCASTAPLQKDEKYPAAWPEISTLGSDGMGLDGSYANEGVAAGDAGPAILLTSILPKTTKVGPSEAKVVSLKLMTVKKNADGNSTARLKITLQGDVRFHYECDCFCVNGNVAFLRSAESGAFAVAGAAGQSNVTLSKAADGSLIAKVDSATAGIILFVPFYTSSVVWARFPRVGD